ncbi:MAG TPA: DNA ligase D [Methylomirabilota bacterium]|jgi:bifunctional non-homologous end joining protein LigD|nr:DNA ligase D [Methylomirabilota bacterium]
MLASLTPAPLADPRFAYEPKYDGIRAIAVVRAGGGPAAVRLWSRLGNDKTAQFPEIARALTTFARRLKADVVLDGEIVALDHRGEPAGFQRLQGRMHLTSEREIGSRVVTDPVAFVAFDVLRDGDLDVRPLPLTARRARLERILGNTGTPVIRLSEFHPGDGRALHRDVTARGWEGLVAKALDAPYQAGRRSDAWRKIKAVRRQECVVGGWTEGRGSRAHFGALLLGVREGGELVYVGHTGTGFGDREIKRLMALLRPLETPTCPFATRPATNGRPHWTRPELVVEIGFGEWTADGVMRHPKYLGLRDDIDPKAVRRDIGVSGVGGVTGVSPRANEGVWGKPKGSPNKNMNGALAPSPPATGATGKLIAALAEIESRGGEGVVEVPGGGALTVSHLDKVFWPGSGLTKGALLRYQAWAARYLLPAVADRPLVMRRHPDGVRGKAFYQQRAPADVPPGVRVETLPVDKEVPSRLIGGSLLTLLFMAQIAAISQDPWFSRVGSLDEADHVVLDLDPMPGVPFATVVDVARWIHDELERIGTPSVPKTSGASGMHVYVPLPPHTSYDAGRIFCEIVARRVAERHPRVATVERAVDARGRRVYVDYMQNFRGKTLATAYSVRASADAGVSTPLTWREVHAGVDRHDFTLTTVPERVRRVGDLWAALRESPGANLAAILDTAKRRPVRARKRAAS